MRDKVLLSIIIGAFGFLAFFILFGIFLKMKEVHFFEKYQTT
jgi:hypothetical protein